MIPALSTDSAGNFYFIFSEFLTNQVQLGFERAMLHFIHKFFVVDLWALVDCLFSFLNEVNLNRDITSFSALSYHFTNFIDLRLQSQFRINLVIFIFLSLLFNYFQIIFLYSSFIVQPLCNIFVDLAYLLLGFTPLQSLIERLNFLLSDYLHMWGLVISARFRHRRTSDILTGLGLLRLRSAYLHHWVRWSHTFFLCFLFVYDLKGIFYFSLWILNAFLQLLNSILFGGRWGLGSILF